MKAEELMIGDWIHLLKNKIDIKGFEVIDACPRKVTAIRTDGDEPYVQTDDCDVFYDMSAYQPIPITTEILKKNGFCQYGDIFKIDGDGFEIQIRLGMYVRVFNGMDNTCNFKTDFYIHNLQHALRMCKINKEMKL